MDVVAPDRRKRGKTKQRKEMLLENDSVYGLGVKSYIFISLFLSFAEPSYGLTFKIVSTF